MSESSTIGQILQRDHEAIDEHFEAVGRSLTGDSVDAGALADGLRALRHHIWVEETLHFPPLRQGGMMGPLMVMVREHGAIWDLMGRLEHEVAVGADPEPTWRELMSALESHNAKEELIVYPGGDEILTQEMADDIRYALLSEETPEGWVCQLAGRS